MTVNSCESIASDDRESLIAKIHQLQNNIHECEHKMEDLLIEKKEECNAYNEALKHDQAEVEKQKYALKQKRDKLNKEKDTFYKEEDNLAKEKKTYIQDQFKFEKEKETLEEERFMLELKKENLSIWKKNFELEIELEKENIDLVKDYDEVEFRRVTNNKLKQLTFLKEKAEELYSDKKLFFGGVNKPEKPLNCDTCGKYIREEENVGTSLLRQKEKRLMKQRKKGNVEKPLIYDLDFTPPDWGTSLGITQQAVDLESQLYLYNSTLEVVALARQAKEKKKITSLSKRNSNEGSEQN